MHFEQLFMHRDRKNRYKIRKTNQSFPDILLVSVVQPTKEVGLPISKLKKTSFCSINVY